MAAYNFKARFAPAVDSGEKRQTIRAMRKHMPKVGERVHLFTGARTKVCRRLRAGHQDVHKSVDAVVIEDQLVIINTLDGGWIESVYPGPELDVFAKRDGFKSWPEMREFFATEHGLPFHGFLAKW